MPLPTISPEQRKEALAKATEARKVRAAALDEMREGRVSLAAVLDNPEPAVQKTKVRTVLLAIPGVGPVRADQVMEEVVIASTRRVRGLRHLQREALLARFPA